MENDRPKDGPACPSGQLSVTFLDNMACHGPVFQAWSMPDEVIVAPEGLGEFQAILRPS